MLKEDHRNITCGGDPFNYLKSVMKGLSIQLDAGQDAEIMLSRDKFGYDRNTFDGLARTTRLKIVSIVEEGQDLRVVLRKEN
ncbi:MAG: hypothetical protein QXN26_01405 [Thermoplasmataceae archaeon]